MRSIEAKLTDLIAGLAPWLAPIPTAYLVGRATLQALGWPLLVAICAAAIVESLGLAATNTALELYQYNRTRRKTDPAAPFALAGVLVLVYVGVAVGLTVALDVFPSLAHYAPAIWPALSLTGVTLLGLRADHARRLEALAQDKAERRAERQATRQADRQAAPGAERPITSNSPKADTNLDALQAGKKAAQQARLNTLLDMYLDNPDLSPSEAARRLGVSRQTIYTYLTDLESAGKIHRNGRTEVIR